MFFPSIFWIDIGSWQPKNLSETIAVLGLIFGSRVCSGQIGFVGLGRVVGLGTVFGLGRGARGDVWGVCVH